MAPEAHIFPVKDGTPNQFFAVIHNADQEEL